MKLRILGPLSAMLLTAALPSVAIAADIRTATHGSGSLREVIIEGQIEAGDYDRFLKAIRDNQGNVSGVHIFSPGGDFHEAIKIGRALRMLELGSRVPMKNPVTGEPTCGAAGLGSPQPKNPRNCVAASAGFFIHIGAVHRGGNHLVVHRPYINPERFGRLTENEAKREFDGLQEAARAYMDEMGVPKHVQEVVLGTPSDKGIVLDERTVKTHFWLELPYRYERGRAQCSQMSSNERQRLKALRSRLRSARDLKLTASELADAQHLRSKDTLELECRVELNRKSRLAAYEKFFGATPSDTTNHNFTRWTDAPNYLGRTFEEITSEETFGASVDQPFGRTSIRRNATTSSPYVSLTDSASRKKYVAFVSVVSAPNPSPEFIAHVRHALEVAFGAPTAAAAANEWRWENEAFAMRLKHTQVSATGPFLSLIVDAKDP